LRFITAWAVVPEPAKKSSTKPEILLFKLASIASLTVKTDFGKEKLFFGRISLRILLPYELAEYFVSVQTVLKMNFSFLLIMSLLHKPIKFANYAKI
jgi:hypothetical protein